MTLKDSRNTSVTISYPRTSGQLLQRTARRLRHVNTDILRHARIKSRDAFTEKYWLPQPARLCDCDDIKNKRAGSDWLSTQQVPISATY